MEMFLMVAALSFLGVAVSALAFAAATRESESRPSSQPATRIVPVVRPQFFADDGAARPRVPIEALLLQIERHVQLEQAAAESFLSDPTAESLHLPSMSPLVH
jgi:hypothetical protein